MSSVFVRFFLLLGGGGSVLFVAPSIVCLLVFAAECRSAFGVQARWPRSSVTLEGARTVFTRTGDGGGVVASSFCPSCGTTVAWEVDTLPGEVVVAVGCFKTDAAADAAVDAGAEAGAAGAGAPLPAPTFAVYEARAHAWALGVVPPDATHWA